MPVYAQIVNQIGFEKSLHGNLHRSFAINLRCKQFWYIDPVPPITLATSQSTITNPGNLPAEPIITVYGSGENAFMAGLAIVELEGFSDSITLDTPFMEAYSGTTSIYSSISRDFSTLASGMNTVSWSSGVTRIEGQPNLRYLI